MELSGIIRLPRRILRRMAQPLSRFLKRQGRKNRHIASFYYTAFRPEFAREQMAFLAGVSAYGRGLQNPANSMALLRRNAHRLEKGLLMRPRRVPFALDYIGETTEAYARASGHAGLDIMEWTWATDVLTKYFHVHDTESSVASWKELFLQSTRKGPCRADLPEQIPYLRDLSVPPPVSAKQLLALVKRRRSVRWFLQKPVERVLIDRALEIGTLAPSACNRQPFEFRIFDNPDLVRQIIDIPFGLAGYGHNVPVVAVVIGQQRHYFDERDRHLIYIDSSLAVMGFILGLESTGLGSCCVNWPDIEEKEKKMAHLLSLAPDERPVMLIAIGHPDPEGMVACSTKKSLSQIRRYNFE